MDLTRQLYEILWRRSVTLKRWHTHTHAHRQ